MSLCKPSLKEYTAIYNGGFQYSFLAVNMKAAELFCKNKFSCKVDEIICNGIASNHVLNQY